MSDTAIVGENVEIIETRGTRSAFTWSVVIAGALAAWAVTFIFVTLGTGIGLSAASPFGGPSAATLGIAGAIWLIFSETAAFATGGYIAARLRLRDAPLDPESKFRDATHGFMVWVLGASVMAIAIFAASIGSVRTAAETAGPIASATTFFASQDKDQNTDRANPVAYYVDRLFRAEPRRQATEAAATPPAPAAPATTGAGSNGESNRPGTASEETQRGEALRILALSLTAGKFDQGDRQYLGRLVAARAGITPEQAEARVTEVRDQAAAKLKETAETARKAGAYFSFWSFMALLFGAAAATLAGMLGGELRDEI